MRCITITYRYSGDEKLWRETVEAFIAAIEGDPAVSGKFTYQVATADDGETRIHWGRWDSAETLQALQSQPYFKVFAQAVKGFAGGAPSATGADVAVKSTGW